LTIEVFEVETHLSKPSSHLSPKDFWELKMQPTLALEEFDKWDLSKTSSFSNEIINFIHKHSILRFQGINQSMEIKQLKNQGFLFKFYLIQPFKNQFIQFFHFDTFLKKLIVGTVEIN
jgi:hypothetical protein